MNTTLVGGVSGFMLISFWAQITGPIVLVCRCKAKSENDLDIESVVTLQGIQR